MSDSDGQTHNLEVIQLHLSLIFLILKNFLVGERANPTVYLNTDRTSILKLNSENIILTVCKTSHFMFFFKKGQTALHIAAGNNNQDIVTVLLNRDCDPNITNAKVSISYQRIRICKVTRVLYDFYSNIAKRCVLLQTLHEMRQIEIDLM